VQSTIALLLNALPTPSLYPDCLHLAQARFLIILSTAIAAYASGPSLKALILSAMEEAPRLILAIDLGAFFIAQQSETAASSRIVWREMRKIGL
jgi:hypothetical protein